MLTRRLLNKKQLWIASYNCTSIRYVQNVEVQETHNLETQLPAPIKKKPARKPFLKNLFLGAFDHEFIYYPEPQTKDRHVQFFEWLKPIEECLSESLESSENIKRDEILSRLKDLGVFRANVDVQYDGLNLSKTELSKLMETLSCFPWLGSYIVKNHIIPTQIISLLASDQLKAKYLPKIASGNIIPTLCYTEPENGINIHSMNTKIILSDCNTHWILNGKKTFVVNGHDSNLFIVYAHCINNQGASLTDKGLSVLLVDKNLDGITYTNTKTLVGQKENLIHTVTFRNTKVPKENLLGDIGSGLNILVDLFSPGNREVAPQAVGILKTFTKLLTTHILQRKHLDQDLHQFEAVQEVLGKLATKLYGMESLLYMTTGMIDEYEHQDCTLEKAVVEKYCTNECITCIYEGLQVIGAQSYTRENPYIQIFEDALSYTLFDCYNVDSSTYISLIGLQHTGKHLHEHILRLRNPFHFPKYIIKWIFGKEHKLNLEIADHMHPSLQISAETLERCITKLQTTALLLLERHGSEISHRHMELRRLGEMATLTFALTAVLSRASRSYCIGLRNCEQDRHLASSFAIFTVDKMEILMKEIVEGDWNNGDRLYKNIAELIYSKKDYFAEHPLSRSY